MLYDETIAFPTGINDCKCSVAPYYNLVLDCQIVFNISTVPDTDNIAVYSRLQSGFDCCVVTVTVNVYNDFLATSRRERQQYPQQREFDQRQAS